MMLLRGFLIAVILWFMAVILVASCSNESYAKTVHPHGELALTGYNLQGAQSASSGFFVRNISMRSHFMAKLERDTFECASFFDDLSTNPFQLCHPYLVVNGKAPLKSNGAHNHA